MVTFWYVCHILSGWFVGAWTGGGALAKNWWWGCMVTLTPFFNSLSPIDPFFQLSPIDILLFDSLSLIDPLFFSSHPLTPLFNSLSPNDPFFNCYNFWQTLTEWPPSWQHAFCQNFHFFFEIFVKYVSESVLCQENCPKFVSFLPFHPHFWSSHWMTRFFGENLSLKEP